MPAAGGGTQTLAAGFFVRPVCDVARDLIGCSLVHAGCSGVIVETEAYHESEPACHAYAGPTPRNAVLFGAAASIYVYLSYGMHELLNFVTGERDEGSAVLIRALAPVEGIAQMRARRGVESVEDLCSGPGKLTQALAVGLELNGRSLDRGPIRLLPRGAEAGDYEIVRSTRIGITKGKDLPWRFCVAGSRFVSRPRP